MLRKLFCKHRFQLLSTYEKDIDKSVGYQLGKIHVIYCPKCKKEQKVLEREYNTIIAKQKADDEYERQRREKIKQERDN